MSDVVVLLSNGQNIPVIVDGSPGVAGPIGPAGDVARAATRSALAAVTASAGLSRLLTEAGREGIFVFSSSNLSALVTADPNQGVYVAPASDTTGASGAWVRKTPWPHNVKWFGATGDGTTNDGAAIAAAVTYLNALGLSGFGYGQGVPKLFIPAGHYYLGTTTLDITHTMIIEGENGADAGGASTVLRWAGSTGIRVQTHNTTGASGTQASAAFRGDGSIIRNLFLKGDYTTTEAEYHGIHLRGKATIRDCYIHGFRGDGIFANVTAGSGGATEGNVNCFEFSRLIIQGCRNGVYLIGADVNAGSGNFLDVMDNRSRGIDDNSFLGNTWTACHTSGNIGAPYRTTNNNAASVFVGCYSESGQPNSSFVYQTVVIGGQHAAGITGTGVWLRNLLGIATFDNLGATSASINSLQVNTGGVYENGAQLTIFSGFNNGNYLQSGVNISFGGTPHAGFFAGATAGGGIPYYVGSSELDWFYTGDGFVHWTLDNTHMNLTGYYQCDGGYRVGATVVINGSGVLQAAAFPALTGDVTTSAGSLATTLSSATVVAKIAGQAIAPASSAATGSITSSGGGIGYATGAGGTVTQATSKTTGVTLDKLCGDITMNAAALAASTTVSFVLTSNKIAAGDTLILRHSATGTFGAYTLNAHGFAAGSCTIDVRNVSLGSLSEAIVIRYAVIKAVQA